MQKAEYYHKLEKNRVQCMLCPHNCIISEGRYGKCKARVNKDGELYSETYGFLTSIAIDPVEKKPLYHFFPGEDIFSIGSFACTMHCMHCQNHSISQADKRGVRVNEYSPEEVVSLLKSKGITKLAFTYNEPVVFFEFMLETAQLARLNGIHTVMVTNGFINPDPLAELLPSMNAFNVDVKGYNEDFYKHITGGRLEPVLSAIDQIKESKSHVELTYLVIPGLNDDPEKFKELISQMAKRFGKDQVVHISRYFPKYKMSHSATDLDKINELYELAREELDYVYLGNVPEGTHQNTYCSNCQQMLIERNNFYGARITGMTDDRCSNCQRPLNGLFI